MDAELLKKSAQELMTEGKGLIAMDESTPTCNKRFHKLGIPETVEMRRIFRDMIITTPKFSDYISGAILYDETIRQANTKGVSFVDLLKQAGIIPGIKVDMGTQNLAGFPGEKITEGLDGLANRLQEYAKMGARFAKWRAVITIGSDIPSWGCIEANALDLARYARLCQEYNIVPIVEPEVLMDGTHTLERCFQVTSDTLKAVFTQLYLQRVLFEGMILKPNMVLPGKDCPKQDSDEAIAEATVTSLLRTVPAAVPGIAFLSGGQSPLAATNRLNIMNKRYKDKMPWRLTFSFSRAIQQPSLDYWHGKEENTKEAQKILYHRAKCNGLAQQGRYSADLER